MNKHEDFEKDFCESPGFEEKVPVGKRAQVFQTAKLLVLRSVNNIQNKGRKNISSFFFLKKRRELGEGGEHTAFFWHIYFLNNDIHQLLQPENIAVARQEIV